MLARLGQPAEAWQSLEEDLGRGLLDEIGRPPGRAAYSAERARLRELIAELERLDRLVETTPEGLDQADRAKRFEELKHNAQLASIALGEFQARLVQDHGELVGRVAKLEEIQAALPADAALVAWVDVPPWDRTRPTPMASTGAWSSAPGATGLGPDRGNRSDGLWTEDDTGLASRVRTELRRRPGAGNGRPAAPARAVTQPSASSRWPRPWAPPPTACRPPGN